MSSPCSLEEQQLLKQPFPHSLFLFHPVDAFMYLHHSLGLTDPWVAGCLQGVQELKNYLNKKYVGRAKIVIIDLYSTCLLTKQKY